MPLKGFLDTGSPFTEINRKQHRDIFNSVNIYFPDDYHS